MSDPCMYTVSTYIKMKSHLSVSIHFCFHRVNWVMYALISSFSTALDSFVFWDMVVYFYNFIGTIVLQSKNFLEAQSTLKRLDRHSWVLTNITEVWINLVKVINTTVCYTWPNLQKPSIMAYSKIFSIIKMSGSESWPRKVELASTHNNVTTTMNILHITTELIKNNPTTLIYSLVCGLYKITTESIKLVLDVENASSDYVDRPYPRCTESVIFFLSYTHPR